MAAYKKRHFRVSKKTTNSFAFSIKPTSTRTHLSSVFLHRISEMSFQRQEPRKPVAMSPEQDDKHESRGALNPPDVWMLQISQLFVRLNNTQEETSSGNPRARETEFKESRDSTCHPGLAQVEPEGRTVESRGAGMEIEGPVICRPMQARDTPL